MQQSAAPVDPRFPLFHGVPAKPTNFVGREKILDRLVARLTRGDASVSAGGTGGAGKTTLAVKLAYDPRILAHFTEGVLWAALGKDPTIEAILADWAGALGLDVSSIAEPADRAQAIKNAVGLRSILFIIDDVWDEAAASLLRCGGPPCAHLLTTRDDGIARAFAGPSATEKILELEPGPAFELLQSLAPEVCAAEPEAARALVRDVGGLPLAIELLGGYLGNPEHTGLSSLRADALREMSDPRRRLQLARERLGSRPGERPTLEQTIALSLEDLPEAVVQAFYGLGAFSPKPDTFELTVAKMVADAEAFVFGVLLRRNLVESSDGKRLSIHPVIAEYASSRMSPSATARHRTAYTAVIAARDWKEIEHEYAQIRHVWNSWNGDERERIRFTYVAQDFQRRRGLWQDRLSWSKEVLQLAHKNKWEEDIIALLANIGFAYHALGDVQAALEIYDRALGVCVDAGDQRRLATILNNIGGVHSGLGQWQQALEHFQRALSIAEELGDHRGISTTVANIGLVYDSQGEQDIAIQYYERALAICEANNDLESMAATLNNMGSVYYATGDWQKALAYYDRVLPIVEKLGDLPGLATTLNNIGTVRRGLGQTQQALEYCVQALTIRQQVGDRLGQVVSYYNVGMLMGELGKAAEAIEQLQACIDLAMAIGHPDLDKFSRALRSLKGDL